MKRSDGSRRSSASDIRRPRSYSIAVQTTRWQRESNLDGYDAVVIPGGFSYGDHLRTGAIARFSPVMEAVVRHADTGKAVIGICNGFQILCESHLLPGALMRNDSLEFRCVPV